MRQFNRAHLLTALRKGPLDTRHWHSVATTSNALKVRIFQLRAAGYGIDSVPVDETGALRTPVPRVRYVLHSEPFCAHCGQYGKAGRT